MTKSIKVSDETHAELTKRMKWGETIDGMIHDLLFPKSKKKTGDGA